MSFRWSIDENSFVESERRKSDDIFSPQQAFYVLSDADTQKLIIIIMIIK